MDSGACLEASLRFLDEVQAHQLLPYYYFSFAKDLFGLKKGALLLVRPSNNSLSIHSSWGFDLSTLSKFQLDADATDTISESLVFSNDNLGFWKPFFSSSDLEDTQTVIAIPLRSGTKLQGMFVLTDSPYAQLPREALETLCKGIGITLGTKLRISRRMQESTLKIKTCTSRLNGDNAAIHIGEMAKTLARTYIGAIPSSIELDIIFNLLELCRPYEPVFNKTEHLLELGKFSPEPDSTRILLQDITIELEDRLFGKDSPHLDLAAYVR